MKISKESDLVNKKALYPFLLFALIWLAAPVFGHEGRLMREPSLSRDFVAFVYANDIWVVPRDGGDARRVTTHPGSESSPKFSPDGQYIAFSGQYDGNTDVYVVPTKGGEPTRLTYHPYPDMVRGWSPDGKHILFASGRDTKPRPYARLWIISKKGGMPEPLPMPMANKGVYSPDGKQMAYVRLREAFSAWRHYRGGRTTGIWLFDLSDYSLKKIPRDNSNDTDPMWIGDTVYFLSDRNYTMNLFSYHIADKKISQHTFHDDYDIKSASADDKAVIYEQAGYLHIFDVESEKSTRLHIKIRGDLPGRRPHFADVARLIRGGDISPTGVRAVLEARGDIFTVPAKKGDYRNLTSSSGAHDRYPTWSPDGKKIAWFSDQSGEFQLMIRDQKGLDPARSIVLTNPSFYYNPVWSPDSKKILFADKRLNFWFVDVEKGKAVKIDKDTYDHPLRSLDYVWAPDSKWIAYSKRLDNHMHALFVYSIEEGKSYQLTDGLSDAISPAFDKGGKYLYFLASTDYGLNTGWLDMTSYDRSFTRGVYLAVLNAKDPSPLLPESDEEEVKKPEEKSKEKKKDKSEEKGKDKDGDKEKEKKEEVTVQINLEGIHQRILALDIPLRNYNQLRAGKKGIFFYAESIPNQKGLSLHRYELKKRETKPFMSGISGYKISIDGKKLLYFARDTIGIVDAKAKAKVGDGKLKTAQLKMKVDPLAEWKQIYNEAWRINRDFLYDAQMHGADWEAIHEKYLPFLLHVAHRSDLSYILRNLIGELTIGHSWAGGGALPNVETVPVGLLGADYEIKNGIYRISNILTGENWNPGLRSVDCSRRECIGRGLSSRGKRGET